MDKTVKQLFEAARNGDVDELGMLIDEGADIKAVDNDGWAAMMWAGWYGRGDCVERLIASGAEVNVAGKDGRTALMCAGLYGYGDCVEKLLAAGADVEIKDRDGKTAAEIARERGYYGVATLIEGFSNAKVEYDSLSEVISAIPAMPARGRSMCL